MTPAQLFDDIAKLSGLFFVVAPMLAWACSRTYVSLSAFWSTSRCALSRRSGVATSAFRVTGAPWPLPLVACRC